MWCVNTTWMLKASIWSYIELLLNSYYIIVIIFNERDISVATGTVMKVVQSIFDPCINHCAPTAI